MIEPEHNKELQEQRWHGENRKSWKVCWVASRLCFQPASNWLSAGTNLVSIKGRRNAAELDWEQLLKMKRNKQQQQQRTTLPLPYFSFHLEKNMKIKPSLTVNMNILLLVSSEQLDFSWKTAFSLEITSSRKWLYGCLDVKCDNKSSAFRIFLFIFWPADKTPNTSWSAGAEWVQRDASVSLIRTMKQLFKIVSVIKLKRFQIKTQTWSSCFCPWAQIHGKKKPWVWE